MIPFSHRTLPFFEWFYPGCLWKGKKNRDGIYLTFDDGPNPEVTQFVLEALDYVNAKATFFCVGKNVEANPEIFREIISRGHRIGNHSYDHQNGWYTTFEEYIGSVEKCNQTFIAHGLKEGSALFRPPYGKLSHRQRRKLLDNYEIVMWSFLAGDFYAKLNGHTILSRTIKSVKNRDVVVLHDNNKSFEKLKFILPKMLQHWKSQGVEFLQL